ncbi:MAG TPA: hypothetical protein VMC85_22920 [Desulfomonilaceae bacterium]|nr:hypothetical protein [Desulfomonilaceae bacterium]
MSDPLGKFYTPYIGLRGKGRKCCGCDTILCYRWRFIGTPLVWNTWNDPFLINCISATQQETIQTLYTLNGTSGYMLEGDFEGIIPLSSNWRGTFWLNGSWMQANGTGRLDSTVQASTLPVFASILTGSVDIPDSQIQRFWYGLGLGLEFSF